MREWPPPASVSELRMFLALASYWGCFVHRFVKLSALYITELLRKGESLKWHKKHQQQLEELNDALTTDPGLCYPSCTDTFVMKTDASNCGLEAILKEEGNIIAFKSLAPSTSERNYRTIQQESLTLLCARVEGVPARPARLAFCRNHRPYPFVWLAGQKHEICLSGGLS